MRDLSGDAVENNFLFIPKIAIRLVDFSPRSLCPTYSLVTA